MKRPAPPSIALWLMRLTDIDPAIVGDLVEAHARGKSSWWFWRQTVSAVQPRPVDFLRWLAALPIALCSVYILAAGMHRMIWTLVGLADIRVESWMLWAAKCARAPVMSAGFVIVATYGVPTHRRFVATAALGVVLVWASYLMLSEPFFIWTFAMGAFGLAGGIASFRWLGSRRFVLPHVVHTHSRARKV